MSTPKEQILAAYKVAIGHILDRIREQSEFLQQTAGGFKTHAVRESAPPVAQGLQALSSGLATSDSIEQLRALMMEDLDGLSEIVTSRSEALTQTLSRL